MNQKVDLILSCFLVIFSLHHLQAQQPVDFVDPFIGTSNGGNTLPGAVVPWGMAYVSPHNDTLLQWSGARYFFGKKDFFGFGQNHMSGVGCGDFANIVVIPVTDTAARNHSLSISEESATPGYYAANISNGVRAEVTATERTSLLRFTYKSGVQPVLLFNVSRGASPSTDGYVQINDNTEIVGYNSAGGFCKHQNSYTIYFVARFSKPAAAFGTWEGTSLRDSSRCQKGENIGAWLSFINTNGEPLLVKIGISYVSIANARANLLAEQPGWDFEKVQVDARAKWNRELSKIAIEGGTDAQKTIFYTALYHSLIHPNIINDANGQYPAMKTRDVQQLEPGHNQYTVFSLWDTYRTLHPLLTLVWPERQTDMLRTMADMAKHGGDLPFWELGADESYVMNGDPAAIVVADSYLKGLNDFDTTLALNTMLRTAFQGEGNKIRPMNKYFMKYGYIPWDDCGPDDVWGKPRMVSECLEYAYADWAIAQMARKMGHLKTAASLEARSKAYRHYFDKETSFLRPKNVDGSWYKPFQPFGPPMKSMPGFVEGNSWQYTFFVPHDIEGLRALMGGNKPFVEKLQTAFDSSYFTVNNEPDIAYPYLFTYVEGEEWRTAREVHRILERDFSIGPAGLPGNDDAGTISAWYVFSAIGLYPDCPGKPDYRVGSPLFDKVTIHLNKEYYPGGAFIFQSKATVPPSVRRPKTLNNKPFRSYGISHRQIVTGGELKFGK